MKSSVITFFPSTRFEYTAPTIEEPLFDFDIVSQNSIEPQEHNIVVETKLEELSNQESFELLSMMPQPTQQTFENDNFSVTGNKRKTTQKNDKTTKRRKVNNDNDNSGSPYNSAEDNGTNVDKSKQKRQNRLVKNREAAQLFRQRQKTYIQDLEKKVESLVAGNHQLTSKTELLESENRLLRDQLNYLRGFLSQIMSMAFPMQTSASMAAMTGMPAFNFEPQPSVPANSTAPVSQSPCAPSSSPVNAQIATTSTPNESNNAPNVPSEANPAYSVAAAFQAAMGFSAPPAAPNQDS